MVYIVIVNYNNSHYSIECLNSIKNSEVDYRLYIVDNNSKIEEREKLSELKNYKNVELFFLNQNIGYFPALDYAYQRIRDRLNTADYLVIGNNDLQFSERFFKLLIHKNYSNSTYVVCPDIVNCDDNHQNPAVKVKYSKKQLLFLDLYHSGYIIAIIINLISKYIKFRGSQKSKNGWKEPGFISIGYGACYVLTQHYWKHITEIPNYLFLMNEENALSDLVFKNGGRIYYDPELIVNHMEHSSVAIAPKKKIYRICQQSYKESKKHFDNSQLYDKQLI